MGAGGWIVLFEGVRVLRVSDVDRCTKSLLICSDCESELQYASDYRYHMLSFMSIDLCCLLAFLHVN